MRTFRYPVSERTLFGASNHPNLRDEEFGIVRHSCKLIRPKTGCASLFFLSRLLAVTKIMLGIYFQKNVSQ